MNAQQIIDEAEGQLWLGDAEPDALHQHNRKVIEAAVKKALLPYLALTGKTDEVIEIDEEGKVRAAHASEPWTVATDQLQQLAQETAERWRNWFKLSQSEQRIMTEMILAALEKARDIGVDVALEKCNAEHRQQP